MMDWKAIVGSAVAVACISFAVGVYSWVRERRERRRFEEQMNSVCNQVEREMRDLGRRVGGPGDRRW